MKKLAILLLILGLLSCEQQHDETIGTDLVTNSSSAKGKKGNLPEIVFEEEEFDFGPITQGEVVSHAFNFTNTGKTELIISAAEGSCGCTVPEYSKKPIAPGKSGKINVVFDSEGKKGMQEKTITVVTNCEPSTRVIRIKANIIVAETAK